MSDIGVSFQKRPGLVQFKMNEEGNRYFNNVWNTEVNMLTNEIQLIDSTEYLIFSNFEGCQLVSNRDNFGNTVLSKVNKKTEIVR